MENLTDLEILQLDAIVCEDCGKLCGDGTDIDYNTEYYCCENCVNDVRAAINNRYQHEKDCLSFIL